MDLKEGLIDLSMKEYEEFKRSWAIDR